MKTITFYLTVTLTMVLLCSEPSLTWLLLTFIDMLLMAWCIDHISPKELAKLSGYDIWHKMLN